MSIKQETGQDDEVNTQSLLPRMPPLIPLPWPGHWLSQTKTVRDDKKTPSEKETLYLKCSSCLNSSLILSCGICDLLCLPCWSVMAMALEHLTLNSGQIYRVELMVTGENQKWEGGLGKPSGCRRSGSF